MTISASTTTKSYVAQPTRADATDQLLLATPVRSQWQIDLQRLRRHRAAMAGLMLLLTIVIAACLAPWLSPYPYEAQNLDFIRAAPSAQFPLGTDSLGRDLLSRLLHGARIALLTALVVVTLEFAVGVPLGMVAGYYRGRLDVAVNTLADVVWAFPPLVLALGVVAAVGPGLFNTMVVIALVSWVPFTRVTRAKVLSLRQRDFVQASMAIGCTDRWILRRHILPNILTTNLVLVTLTLPTVLLTVAALSFLGFGVQPPTPEWGAMLSEGRPYLQNAPWISTFPGLAILLTVVGFNLLGDGVRDVFDPKQTW
ncbi:MAG TPA: ABC transporter permease [Caldilineaceae bacterium]|nr:ABC transporter permease [Caldilineaceae bacterium]